MRRRGTESSQMSGMSLHSRKDHEDDEGLLRPREVDGWGIGDEARMGLE